MPDLDQIKQGEQAGIPVTVYQPHTGSPNCISYASAFDLVTIARISTVEPEIS